MQGKACPQKRREDESCISPFFPSAKARKQTRDWKVFSVIPSSVQFLTLRSTESSERRVRKGRRLTDDGLFGKQKRHLFNIQEKYIYIYIFWLSFATLAFVHRFVHRPPSYEHFAGRTCASACTPQTHTNIRSRRRLPILIFF